MYLQYIGVGFIPIVVVVEALDEAFELLGEPGLHTGDADRTEEDGIEGWKGRGIGVYKYV